MKGRKDSGLGSCYIQLQPRLAIGKEYMIIFLHYLFPCFYFVQLFTTCCYLILTPYNFHAALKLYNYVNEHNLPDNNQ